MTFRMLLMEGQSTILQGQVIRDDNEGRDIRSDKKVKEHLFFLLLFYAQTHLSISKNIHTHIYPLIPKFIHTLTLIPMNI